MTPEQMEARISTLEARETGRIQEEIKDWPEELRKAVSASGGLDAQAAAVESLRPTVAALKSNPAAGHGPNPKTGTLGDVKITSSRKVRL